MKNSTTSFIVFEMFFLLNHFNILQWSIGVTSNDLPIIPHTSHVVDVFR